MTTTRASPRVNTTVPTDHTTVGAAADTNQEARRG